MNLTTPTRVQKLQTALHDKAKESPNFRFYALYDKVCRKDVLAFAFAYACCRANGGAAGVDGQTFEDIEAYGVERWLDELGARAEKQNLSTAARAAGVYTQAGRSKAIRGARDQRSSRGNGSSFGARTDLRGRPAAGPVRLSAGPQRYEHAVRSFGLFAPRTIHNSSAAVFTILGQTPRPRPTHLKWAMSIKRDFGWDPLLDHMGNRMRWTRRIPPGTTS